MFYVRFKYDGVWRENEFSIPGWPALSDNWNFVVLVPAAVGV